MGRIHVLDQHVAELIAAGEVVERPSSVIKELLENAVDAGATSVTVEIKHGGVSYLRVTDNGCGIAREDVPVAFLRHATSKVNSQKDLEGILTLGFSKQPSFQNRRVQGNSRFARSKQNFSCVGSSVIWKLRIPLPA